MTNIVLDKTVAEAHAAFRDALEQAKRRSGVLGRPVLASSTSEIAALEGLQPPLDGRASYFVWEQPQRRFSLTGLGSALSLRAGGDQRFGCARERIQDLLTDAVIDRPPSSMPRPLLLAGFRFTAATDPDPRWAGFPDALVTVPRVLITRECDKTSLTLNAQVSPREDLDALISSTLMELLDPQPVPPAGAPARPTPDSSEETDPRQAWDMAVNALTDQIAAGRAAKVVLARRLDVQTSPELTIDAVLQRLRERFPACTVFAVRNGGACFLGATPETLVELHADIVSTDCLAGSARRGSTPAEDAYLAACLLEDDKERREHGLVATYIREALDGVCSDIRIAEQPEVRRMANVQHLYTPVTARTAGRRHVLELVERLHPTPAVAGVPRQRALCLIEQHEGFDRGWYAGPLGWVDAEGNGEFAVALRSALVGDGWASLFAGCGIVAGSDPAREYAESGLKLEAMRWALGRQ